VLIDVHCHLHEFSNPHKFKEIVIIAVSDDLKSSIKTIKLCETEKNWIPAIGIHPWEVKNTRKSALEEIKHLVARHEIKVLGEIGLDKKFVPETWDKQLIFFKFFLKLANEYNLILNLHSAGAWQEVFNLLVKYDIEKALFHWYTGPLDLLEKIESKGYFIGINPAITIQEKHKEVAKISKNFITESDGPYKYRGLELNPLMIKNTIKIIAELRNESVSKVEKRIEVNFRKYFEF